MRISKKAFKGGYRFKNFKGEPEKTVTRCDMPDKIVVPLQQGYGGEVEALVKTGDTVKAGQIIGRSDGTLSSPAHSSVAGTVSELSKIQLGGDAINTVVIETADGFDVSDDAILRLHGHDKHWERLQAEKLEELIYLSGAASLDTCGIPTRFNTAMVGADDIRHIIVQCVEDELLPFSLDAVAGEYSPAQIIAGCRIIKRIMPNASATIAISKNKKQLLSGTGAILDDDDQMAVMEVSDRYPQSRDEVLVPTVLGGGFPYGFEAVQMGVLVVSLQTVCHVYDAVANGIPVLERIISVCGTGFENNIHVKTPVGTMGANIIGAFCKTNVEDGAIRYVYDSLLTGPTISDTELPIARTCRSIYAIKEAPTTELFSFASPGFAKDSYSNTFPTFRAPFAKNLDTNIHGEARACLSCSFCVDSCPVGILPNLIHRYVERDLVEENLQELGIFRCIDCNLCTYVCPSKIPVAGLVKKGKDMLKNDGINDDDKYQSEFALRGTENR